MLNIVTAPENWLFASALCLMMLIGVAEALGLGTSSGDFGSGDIDHPALGWLGLGPLPLSIALILFLGIFGLGGFAGQEIAAQLTGARLPPLAAAGLALLAAIPLTGFLGRAVARILPADESTAVDLDTLIGRRGHVVLGTASVGAPARAKVKDAFGQAHYPQVEPHLAGAQLRQDDEILLIGRDAGIFRAVAVAPHIIFAEGEAA